MVKPPPLAFFSSSSQSNGSYQILFRSDKNLDESFERMFL